MTAFFVGGGLQENLACLQKTFFPGVQKLAIRTNFLLVESLG